MKIGGFVLIGIFCAIADVRAEGVADSFFPEKDLEL